MIRKLEVNHFTVFKKASFTFGDKLNVVVGENGSGKSQLLKLLYAWTQGAFASVIERSNGSGGDSREYFRQLFKCDEELRDLVNYAAAKKSSQATKATARVSYDSHGRTEVSELQITLVSHGQSAMLDFPLPLDWEAFDGSREMGLFLPARDMLTLYPNFQSLSKVYHLPYDGTYEDAIVKLGIPYLREEPLEFKQLICSLEESIQGKIYLKNERFHYQAKDAPDGFEQDVNMAAEGWRKLGEVIQLLRNGQLRSGMALFWDEPEANLNPKLIRLMAKAILELAKTNIQVFITTQSLFLLREIDLLTKGEKALKKGEVRFFNLLGKGKVEQGDVPEELGDILLLDESLAQSSRFMDMEE